MRSKSSTGHWLRHLKAYAKNLKWDLEFWRLASVTQYIKPMKKYERRRHWDWTNDEAFEVVTSTYCGDIAMQCNLEAQSGLDPRQTSHPAGSLRLKKAPPPPSIPPKNPASFEASGAPNLKVGPGWLRDQRLGHDQAWRRYSFYFIYLTNAWRRTYKIIYLLALFPVLAYLMKYAIWV